MRKIFFLALLFVFDVAIAQVQDKLIYQVVLDSVKEKNETEHIVVNKTISRELKHIFWEIKYGRIFFVASYAPGQGIDTLWKPLLAKAGSLSIKEKKLKGKDFIDNVVFVSRKSVTKPFKDVKEGWKAFYLKYPDSKGFKEFSRIVYSDNKKRALVYMGKYKASLNAGGIVYFFINEEGKWKIQYEVELWVA